LQAGELMVVQREQVRVSVEDLRRAETLFEIRSVPLSDVLTARAALASARASLIDRENGVEAARANLAFVLGLRGYVRIEPVQREFAIKKLILSYEEALARALEYRPDLRSQKLSMLRAKEDLKGTRYELLHPTVSMSTSYSWQLRGDEEFQGPEDLFMKNYGYSLNLSVSLPIFNRFSTKNSIKSQQLSYRQSVEDLDQAERQVGLDIRQAFLNIELYRRSIEANELAVSAAEESYKLVQERYNLGSGTQLERLQTQSSLFAARSNLVQAIFNYQIQLAQLDQAMGTPVRADNE
jgi:outer membrane protein TolC